MVNKRALLTAISVFIVLCVWFVAAPYLTVLNIVNAAVAGDVDELSETVDFNAVREAMKSEVRVQLAKEMSSELKNNPFAAFGGMLASKMVDSVLDVLVTPEGVIGVLKEKGLSPKDIVRRRLISSIVSNSAFVSLDRFKLTIPNPQGKENMSVILKRNGFTWRITRVQIPFDEIRKYNSRNSAARAF